MNHTPGPWRIPTPSMGFSAIRGANGELIFGLAAGSADEKQPDDLCEANARLIAAAPDMLAALCEVETVLMIVQPRSHMKEYLAALARVRAAIARARGEAESKTLGTTP